MKPESTPPPRRLELLIGNHWQSGTGNATIDVHNPATEQVVAVAASAAIEDLDAAAESASQGFRTWRSTPALERSRVMREAAGAMRRRAAEIGALLTAENGKTLREGQAEVHWAADFLEWYAEESRRTYGRVIPPKIDGVRQMVIREPVGPVLALCPWNWPLVTAARKVSPALAAGCSVVLKPAEEAPSAAIEMVRELIAAGLPAGVVNVVLGDPALISGRLIAHPKIRKISFTGSVQVGKLLGAQAAAHMKRITLELGGHAPVIVCADADLPAAVQKILPIKFRTSGQVCSCPSRFFVHRSVRQEFVRLMADAVRALKVGNGALADSDMGPMISTRRLEAMESLVADAKSKGAHVVCGGERVGTNGYFFAPTVLDNVPDTARVMHEEPFGPLVPIAEFDDIGDVISRANAVPLGLSAYVFTNSLAVSRRLSAELECGMVGVNSLAVSIVEAPFGGVKDSGYGQEGGIEGIGPYMVDKFIVEAD